nr:MAG TPA: hypothetical protein [Caudoviricetes sp.]
MITYHYCIFNCCHRIFNHLNQSPFLYIIIVLPLTSHSEPHRPYPLSQAPFQ